ncbi:uncharacterized protein [Littorina saxatilis]|uniref:uncharacterized protein isoform X2 n=1 Tax=Littorina saxatilis TaxID=31220 RepID=UPI0038B5A99B
MTMEFLANDAVCFSLLDSISIDPDISLWDEIDGDLDLLSSDLLDLIPPVDTDVFDDFAIQPLKSDTPPTKKQKVHTDHDYFAHLSPGQHSDSGVSLNSLEQDDSYLPSMAATDDHRLASLSDRVSSSTSPYQSESMSPHSDTSDSNPLGLEDFDFSTCMDFGEGLGLDTINTSALSDVSIDFDSRKSSEFRAHSTPSQQHVQTIKTSSGQQAIILVDATTRQPIKIHSVLTRKSSDSDSLPFTMKDIDSDLYSYTEDGRFPDLRLTDEEKELLAREGVSLPANMPLTKEEERVLKSVRRKIRNKISAKESRKRKQGYVDGLERRVKVCTQENQHLHKKVDNLTKENTSLVVQLNKLKAMVSKSGKGHAQASTCVMVLLLSFALLVIPNISPFGSDIINPLAEEGGVRGNARSLLAKDAQQVAKMSLSTERDDTDPYGVSPKPGLLMDDHSPAAYSAKNVDPAASLAGIHDDDANKKLEGHLESKVRSPVVDMEINDTENIVGVEGGRTADSFQSDEPIKAEAETDNSGQPHEKRAHEEVVRDDGL